MAHNGAPKMCSFEAQLPFLAEEHEVPNLEGSILKGRVLPVSLLGPQQVSHSCIVYCPYRQLLEDSADSQF